VKRLSSKRLGVQVIAGPPEFPGKDASYQAGHVLHLLRATPQAGQQPGAMHPMRTLSGVPY